MNGADVILRYIMCFQVNFSTKLFFFGLFPLVVGALSIFSDYNKNQRSLKHVMSVREAFT